MAIRPRRGGRITSLKLRGEELLDQGIGVDDPGASGFVEGGAWGWDEMVPNIEPTESLPDHGEAWRVVWEALRRDGSSIAMRARGHVVPWELERAIRLSDDSIDLAYVYTNRGAVSHLAYWAGHPLFKYEADMEVSAHPELSRLAEGASRKVLIPPGSIDFVRLGWKTGTRIEMTWDPDLTPYVGIWACNADLGGYRQVAIEPATGGHDRPDPEAPPPLLEPGARLGWWLRISAL